MLKTIANRHGEICFEKINSIPENIKKSNDNKLLTGVNGNSHTFKGGNFYPKVEDEYIFGYFEAKDTILIHKEHGDNKEGNNMIAVLPDGYYRLRRAVEYINGELKQVID